VESLERLLEAAGLTHPCDLDLMLFLDRHPDALMTTEHLAAFLGYDLAQLAKSLDFLGERQLLLRSQKPAHFARLYRFRAEHADERLQEILEVASTLEGRRHLRQILKQNHAGPKSTPLPRSPSPPSQQSDAPEDADA
jgi:DNA-binding MarR family transcriptional regulator